jgi:hypothetical protein
MLHAQQTQSTSNDRDEHTHVSTVVTSFYILTRTGNTEVVRKGCFTFMVGFSIVVFLQISLTEDLEGQMAADSYTTRLSPHSYFDICVGNEPGFSVFCSSLRIVGEETLMLHVHVQQTQGMIH